MFFARVSWDWVRWFNLLAEAAPEPLEEDVDPLTELQDTVQLTDLRGQRRTKSRGKAHGRRKMEGVTGILLHQTAALLSTPNRFLNVPAHSGVTTRGDVVLMHPASAYLWHGHAANKFTVGVEIAARAAGTEGNARTFWRSKREKAAGKTYEQLVHEISDDQILAARALIAYHVATCPNLKVIGAHRQSHKSRTSDPGSRIWQEVGEWAIKEFGLKEGPVVGSGHPIPEVWRGGEA